MPSGGISIYTEQLANQIIDGLSQGKTLISTCKELGIGYSTVNAWIVDNKEFGKRYSRARESQMDFIAEDIIHIAENEELSPETRRLMIDSRKWYAGKLNGKKYGDKQQIDHSGTVTLSALVEDSYKITSDKPQTIDVTPPKTQDID